MMIKNYCFLLRFLKLFFFSQANDFKIVDLTWDVDIIFLSRMRSILIKKLFSKLEAFFFGKQCCKFL